MSQYTKSTNFATKDNLTPGDPLKIVRGTEIDTEYNNIATAIATKTDNASAAITGGTINATTIGATTASTGAFSTLSATGAITSTLATGTAPLVIASTTKVANLNVDSLDGADWASPAALGSTTPAAVSATTLTTSSTVTFNGGTANGVAYLNGSKVVTSGTALWFDGTNFGVGTGGNTLNQQSVVYKAGANTVYQQIANGSTGLGATNGIRVGVSSAGVGEWYSPTAAISYIDNTEQMRLTSTGLGIGTSSPDARLTLYGNAPAFTLQTSRSFTVNRNWQIGVDQFNEGDWTLTPSTTLGGTTYSTPAISVTATGNLGLGVTPSAWYSTARAMQLGVTGSIFGRTGNEIVGVASNAYNDAVSTTSYKYIASGNLATSYLQTTGQHQWYNAPSGTAGNAITFTQAMTLDASGNLLVGTTTSNGKLTIKNPNVSGEQQILKIQNATSTGDLGGFTFNQTDDMFKMSVISGSGYLSFGTGASATERARIDSSGNLGIGTTNTTPSSSNVDGFVVNSTGYISLTGNATSAIDCNRTNDGIVQAFRRGGTLVGNVSVTTTATAFNTSSDYRLKENIQDANSASSLIDSLQVRQFDWKSDNSHQRYGFVAQELVTVAPEAVHQPEDTEQMMAVDYSKLVPMLVKEIQSLRKRLADAGI